MYYRLKMFACNVYVNACMARVHECMNHRCNVCIQCMGECMHAWHIYTNVWTHVLLDAKYYMQCMCECIHDSYVWMYVS